MKVVFLDIDGVLQPYNVPLRFDNLSIKKIDELSRKWDVDYSKYNINEISSVYYDWDELAIARLKYILKETNARIIMSSEWRSKEQLYKMRDLLRIHYLGDYWACDNVILDNGKDVVENRALEIKNSLSKYPVDNFVILDDMKGLEEYYPDNTVITDNTISLNDTTKCVRILKK